MASIKYRIKGRSNPVSIYARLYHNGESTETKTGFQINSADWSAAKQKVKQTKNSAQIFDKVNADLLKLSQFFNDQINLAQSEETTITSEWLKDIVLRCFNNPTSNEKDNEEFYYIPFVENYIEFAKTAVRPKKNTPVSPRTIYDYSGTLKKLKQYETEIHKAKLRHTEITQSFHTKFISFCRDRYKINDKTIGGEIDNLRLFCRKVEKKGYKVSQDFKDADFYSPDNETHDFALSEDEVTAVTSVDLSYDEKLDNARDWFVVGLWTGLRVGDLLNLNSDNIEDGFIKVTNKKTGIPVVIPIHSSVAKTLLKRNNSFPRRISTQKFNIYIKDVAKLAGLNNVVTGGKKVPIDIDKKYSETGSKTAYRKRIGKYKKYELVSSHCCRRTFATFHYGKLDTLTIMHITGHKTERQFLDYVKITPTQHATAMKDMWNKYYKNVT